MHAYKIIHRKISLSLFLLELGIALLVPSQWFIRHSMGDFIVVILLYSMVQSFVKIEAKRLAIAVLLFAFTVEFAQYLHLVDVLGIENPWLRVIIGTHFSAGDLLMYTLGCLAAYGIDRYWIQRKI